MVHFHWQLPQTRKPVHKRKTQTQHQARGSISVQDKLILWNHCLECFILHSIHWIFCPKNALTSPLFLTHQPELRWDEWAEPKEECPVKRQKACAVFSNINNMHFSNISHSSCRNNYLWDFRCDGDSEEVHGYVHTSHHENKQAMAWVAMGAQALL